MADASVSIGFDATELASGVARARALMDGFSKDTVSSMAKAQSATLGRNFGQGIQDELRSLALFGNDTKVAFQEASKAAKEAEQGAARLANLQARQAQDAVVVARRREAIRLEASEANRLASIRRNAANEDLMVMELKAAGRAQEAAALERELSVRRRASALAKDLVISQQNALRLAERQIAAEERVTASQRNRATRGGGSAFGGFAGAAGSVAAGAGLYVGVAALGEFGRESVRVAAEVDSLKSGLASLGETGEGVERRVNALRRVTADLKGLRFEDAVRGEINLRATGITAEKSEEIIRQFGNALLLVGRGEELGGVILALNQINGKGKVFAEEVNQIAERLPQIRSLMREAFGTANTEEIQKMNLSFQEFINRLLGELAKLPRAMGSLKSDLTAVREETRQLQAEVGNMLAPGLLGMARFTRDTLKFVGALKEATVNGDRFGDAIARAFGHAPSIKEMEDRARSFSDFMGSVNVANAQYAEAIGKQLPGFNFEQMAKVRLEMEKLKDAIADSDEEKLERIKEKIEAYRGALGGYDAEQVLLAPGAFSDDQLKAAVELARLQRERISIERSIGDEVERQNGDIEEQRQRAIELRDQKAQQVRANAETRGMALGELKLIELQAAGQIKKAEELEKQLRIQELMMGYRDQLNVSEAEALRLAQRRVDAEDKLRKDGESEGRRRIKGYSQEQDSFKRSQQPFRELDAMKARQGDDFFKRNQSTPGLDRLRDLQDRSKPAFPGGSVLKDQLNARNQQDPAQGRVRPPAQPERGVQGMEKLLTTAVEELKSLNKNLEGF